MQKHVKVNPVTTKDVFISSLENRYFSCLTLKCVIAFSLTWRVKGTKIAEYAYWENQKVINLFFWWKSSYTRYNWDPPSWETLHQTVSIKIFQLRNEKATYEEARIWRDRTKEEQPHLQFRPLFRCKWYKHSCEKNR